VRQPVTGSAAGPAAHRGGRLVLMAAWGKASCRWANVIWSSFVLRRPA